MITIGWLTFLAAWVMNICFYMTHPAPVLWTSAQRDSKTKCSYTFSETNTASSVVSAVAWAAQHAVTAAAVQAVTVIASKHAVTVAAHHAVTAVKVRYFTVLEHYY